jgi:hypothetical protein
VSTKASKTRDDLVQLAKDAAAELLAAFPGLEDAHRVDRAIAILQAQENPNTSAAKLKSLCRADTTFGNLRGGWMQIGGTGQLVQDHALGIVLVNAAIDKEPLSGLIDGARAFAKTGATTTMRYWPLAGTEVRALETLEDGLEIVPWAEVAESYRKRIFSGTDPSLFLSPFMRHPATPTAAVRRQLRQQKVLFRSHDEIGDRAGASEELQLQEKTSDVIRCLTALTAKPVAILGSWTELGDPIGNRIIAISYTIDDALFDKAFLRFRSTEPITPGTPKKLLRGLAKLGMAERAALRIALDRLNQAVRRASIVDRAIDLGIAFEVMLLHGIGRRDTGELRYRASVRAASFIGGKRAERVTSFEIVRAAYDLRSAAAHEGHMPKSKKGQHEEQLRAAELLCAQIARRLIARGKFPDWDSEYVVGGTH